MWDGITVGAITSYNHIRLAMMRGGGWQREGTSGSESVVAGIPRGWRTGSCGNPAGISFMLEHIGGALIIGQR